MTPALAALGGVLFAFGLISAFVAAYAFAHNRPRASIVWTFNAVIAHAGAAQLAAALIWSVS